jgi:hypothetical protein
LGGGDWEEISQGIKLKDPISVNKNPGQAHVCDPSYTGGTSKRISVQAAQGKHEILL